MRYVRIVNGQQVFSDNKDIPERIMIYQGRWVSNPTPEMIAEEGWVPFTPPPVPASPQTEPGYEEVLAAVKKMLSTEAESLSDAEALDVAAIYPTWSSKIGQAVTTGERLWYDGKLYKCVQAHTTQAGWEPDKTPALWTEVSIVEIPEWRQPLGAHDAYMQGDRVKHNNFIWESEVDNNTQEPGVYGWTQLPS